jgi:hypothetical protein
VEEKAISLANVTNLAKTVIKVTSEIHPIIDLFEISSKHKLVC